MNEADSDRHPLEQSPAAASPAEAVPVAENPVTSDDITKAPFFNDPVFQKFYVQAKREHGVVEDLFRILDAGRYTISQPETLRDVHEDAFLLYDIAQGKRGLSELLGLIERRTTAAVFASILVDLHHFLVPRLSELTRALPPATEKLQ